MVLHAPRLCHLEAKQRRTSTHQRRGRRGEGMALKTAHPRSLDTFYASRWQAAM